MPTREEIEKFINVFEALSEFEAEQRLSGWGLWTEEMLPIPEAKKVLEWLKSTFLAV